MHYICAEIVGGWVNALGDVTDTGIMKTKVAWFQIGIGPPTEDMRTYSTTKGWFTLVSSRLRTMACIYVQQQQHFSSVTIIWGVSSL